MYLPPPDKKLLKAMVAAQKSEGAFVVINYDTMRAYFSSSVGFKSDLIAMECDANRVNIPIPKSSLQGTLDSLQHYGLINRKSQGSNYANYQVTHYGFTHRAIRIHNAWSAIISHIVFPSIVAFITALITSLVFT